MDAAFYLEQYINETKMTQQGTIPTNGQTNMRLEIICDESHHPIVKDIIPPIVNEFMATHGITRPRTPTKVTISKPNGSWEVGVKATYMNGQIYEANDANYVLEVALKEALHKAYHTPQAGPGLPPDSNGFEYAFASGHGV